MVGVLARIKQDARMGDCFYAFFKDHSEEVAFRLRFQ